jgi:hypothetical protein
MSTKFYKTREFKRLQSKWYKKLGSEGFDDIECTKPDRQDSRFLKFHSIKVNKTFNRDTQEYFRRCRIHLMNFKWGRRYVDKRIFSWYTEGVSYRSMIDKHKEHYKKKVSLFFIYYRINKMKKEMDTLKLWGE